MWRAAPLGWCESLRISLGFGFSAIVRTTPPWPCGRGSPPYPRRAPNAEFRDRNWLTSGVG
jgi:hypothetical protein